LLGHLHHELRLQGIAEAEGRHHTMKIWIRFKIVLKSLVLANRRGIGGLAVSEEE
jgi:hypothetical protein